MDRVTKEKRSEIMSAIRGKWTRPERMVHLFLNKVEVEHVMHPPIKGHPDVLVEKYRCVVFINGCFWHGCPEHYKGPKSNVEFWRRKISRNVARQKETIANLEAFAYRVVVVWEHELVKGYGKTLIKLIKGEGF